ncbi:chromosome segregation protein Csm1/Pcs1-domain-containing protein [Lipomyces japonicus]|uniref:chromosome segregation protein Csm1/Pcs1-domain-containing protein n=1 Tax=Lipomyces japonicus TaxID=56871 RepID=UPI0034CE0465
MTTKRVKKNQQEVTNKSKTKTNTTNVNESNHNNNNNNNNNNGKRKRKQDDIANDNKTKPEVTGKTDHQVNKNDAEITTVSTGPTTTKTKNSRSARPVAARQQTQVVNSKEEEQQEQVITEAPNAEFNHEDGEDEDEDEDEDEVVDDDDSDNDNDKDEIQPNPKRNQKIAKINDWHKLYEKLNVRFQKLQDIRETHTEEALMSFKASAERRFAGADLIIEKLRQENASQQLIINQLREAAQTQQSNLDVEINQKAQAVVADRTADLQTRVKQLEQEKNLLQGKLSGIKLSGLHAQKEELYSDLSGLIVRDVKTENGKIVYDLLQTGRNGAFHYKLSMPVATNGAVHNSTIPAATSASATLSVAGTDHEDVEVTFVPMLDGKRDEALVELLPDYFTEPLTFVRSSAAQFFWKISQALQKKPQS